MMASSYYQNLIKRVLEASTTDNWEIAVREWDIVCLLYTSDSFVKNTIEEIREQVGDGKVLLALSGGVDSSVLAALLAKAIGKQLTCVFVDHGLLLSLIHI